MLQYYFENLNELVDIEIWLRFRNIFVYSTILTGKDPIIKRVTISK